MQRFSIAIFSVSPTLALILAACGGGGGGGGATPPGASGGTPTPTPTPTATPTTGPSSLTITAGGTYSGNWISNDAKTPAVQIETTAPVVIQNCTIHSNATLIKATVSNAHVVVQNCSAYATDPMIAGQGNGDFFYAYQIGSLSIEHNYIENASFGVKLYNTDGWAPSGPIRVMYNKAVNLQGLESDGSPTGRITTNLLGGEDNYNHFVLYADLQNLSGAEIAWNEIDTAPGAMTASISDVINIYKSSGTASTPILIHDNFIYGGYPATPNATYYYAGGIVMDGTGSDTAATTTAFVNIYDNQVVAHAGDSITLVTGHDNHAFSNRVVDDGQYPDGSWYPGGYAGIVVADCACYNQPPSVYYNNWAQNNVSGEQFEYPNAQGMFVPPVYVSGYYLAGCEGGSSGPSSLCTGNAVYSPLPITAADESSEVANWQQKLAANKVTVGTTSLSQLRNKTSAKGRP